MSNGDWQVVIGLEIHMQLKTKSKLFSSTSTVFGNPPNTQANEVDVALPGVLPVLNAEAIRMAVTFGLAINADIAEQSVFARKNYFYPDLPKAYQISQYELPIVSEGYIDIDLTDGQSKTIHIERAHLEEDAGKLVHNYMDGMSGVDLNRSGVPLMEIVSHPEISSAREAVAYMKKIHGIGCYLNICDGNMQEGSLRCDANVSVKRKNVDKLGTRTETKNLNSFRFIEKAIDYEITRQIALLESGGEVLQETRLYDEKENKTRTMRSKENAPDYRYFPDPDLLPLTISSDFIDEMRESLPELAEQRCRRLIDEYQISEQDAKQLTVSVECADYFEECCSASKAPAKRVANWMNTQLTAALNHSNVSIISAPVSSTALAKLLDRINDETISGSVAKQVFEQMWESSKDADSIIKEQNLEQIDDNAELLKIVEQVIADNPKQIEQYRAGKTKVLGFFVGQVMQLTKGRANPAEVNRLFKDKLDS